jgi:hypothetical protein
MSNTNKKVISDQAPVIEDNTLGSRASQLRDFNGEIVEIDVKAVFPSKPVEFDGKVLPTFKVIAGLDGRTIQLQSLVTRPSKGIQYAELKTSKAVNSEGNHYINATFEEDKMIAIAQAGGTFNL